ANKFITPIIANGNVYVGTPNGVAVFGLLSGPPASINATSGTPQSTAINTPFPAPLVVTVTNASGTPVNGVTVTFTPPSSGASGSFAGRSEERRVGKEGVATWATFTGKGKTGSYTVTESAGGITGTPTFALTQTSKATGSHTCARPIPQSTAINTPFPAPLVVTVTNASGTPVNGVTVTFTPPSSGASGSFAG